MDNNFDEKLQKILAHAGIGSRRHCEELIEKGRVTLNGQVARLGDRANGRKDVITVDGKEIERAEHIYIMVHKPRNVLSSTEDELSEGRRTVRDMVNVPGHLYPVGRLDKQSLGLILLTNDGALAHQMTHPRYGHNRTYEVLIEGNPTNIALNKWRKGVDLDGKRTRPVSIDRLVYKDKEHVTWLRIVMREGRKRQIRRVATLLGYEVRTLIRTKLGTLKLGDLPQGKWRYLTQEEVLDLKRTARQQKKKFEERQEYQKNYGKKPQKRLLSPHPAKKRRRGT